MISHMVALRRPLLHRGRPRHREPRPCPGRLPALRRLLRQWDRAASLRRLPARAVGGAERHALPEVAPRHRQRPTPTHSAFRRHH